MNKYRFSNTSKDCKIRENIEKYMILQKPFTGTYRNNKIHLLAQKEDCYIDHQ